MSVNEVDKNVFKKISFIQLLQVLVVDLCCTMQDL